MDGKIKKKKIGKRKDGEGEKIQKNKEWEKNVYRVINHRGYLLNLIPCTSHFLYNI